MLKKLPFGNIEIIIQVSKKMEVFILKGFLQRLGKSLMMPISIIAAAGMAAHLPGVIASMTTLPVIGVPINASLDGMDALLAIVQMPPGIPVATVGINGALNAALLAVQMLAVNDEALQQKLLQYKEDLKKKIVEANEQLAAVNFRYKTN